MGASVGIGRSIHCECLKEGGREGGREGGGGGCRSRNAGLICWEILAHSFLIYILAAFSFYLPSSSAF